MRSHSLYIFLNVATIFYFATGELLTQKNEKRLEITNNFQMCLESFDVHKNKIIRTGDSREMGAKYLTVVDVNSRTECLKSCCGTDKCDVFIFEEKKPGSCYLFHCGPLHDFKCIFMNHDNYTSAVRTNYNIQSVNHLEQEMQISQQEHELKSLRKSGNVVPVEYSFTDSFVNAVTTQTTKLILTTPAPVKQACSHNQYQCRSTGDCIAIYNVCDGIPQCIDGSDEAADLVCPTEKPTTLSPVVARPPQQPLQPEMIKFQHESFPRPWELPNSARQISQHQPLLYPVQQLEVPQIHKGFGPAGYQWDYQPLYEQNRDPYNPVNSFREQNVINPYEQEPPRIFNHKGSRIMEENEAESGIYLDSKQPYIPHYPPLNKPMWQEVQTQVVPATLTPSSIQQKENNEKEIKSTAAPACDTSNEHAEDSSKKKEEVKVVEKIDKNKHSKVSKENSEKPNITKTEPSKHVQSHTSNIKDHKSVIVIEDHSREHERNSLMAERLQQNIENEVLRPKGAVISLALGLTATAVTATLIACRLRVVRRRGRRGHGPYAHDADYLVNGMYL